MKKELLSTRTEEMAKTVENIAHYKEDLYERAALEEETLQIIVFRLSQEWYGVEIRKVKEVIRVTKITYLPSSPEYIAGIVNLRGFLVCLMKSRRRRQRL
jgi:purine-binding chemotaxis protein CheW